MKSKTGHRKPHPEVVEALRQLALKYDTSTAPSIEKIRKIMDKAAKKSGKTLSQTVVEMREEE